ncbi:MAG: NAD kinase [Chlamydiae bacterium]|nr:NAD kinase [Chlamydiota bacterium]
MVIALFPKVQEEESKRLARKVIDFLTESGATVVVEDDKASALDSAPLSSVKAEEVEFLITMGGDGSMLRIAHQYSHLDGAILGINLGHLGFMADVQIAEIIPCLKDLLAGAYTIQSRITIEGESNRGDAFFALNDFVLHRSHNPSLIEIAIFIDDLFLSTFEADGVILATPNGSTAYSLAAGGPILSPEIEALVITPICPHTISNRPIVITPNRTIRIEYVSKNDPIECVADGFQHFEMSTGDSIQIKKSSKSFKLVNLNRIDYFSTLRTKLGWAGKLR